MGPAEHPVSRGEIEGSRAVIALALGPGVPGQCQQPQHLALTTPPPHALPPEGLSACKGCGAGHWGPVCEGLVPPWRPAPSLDAVGPGRARVRWSSCGSQLDPSPVGWGWAGLATPGPCLPGPVSEPQCPCLEVGVRRSP